jgi:hypothetical protein
MKRVRPVIGIIAITPALGLLLPVTPASAHAVKPKEKKRVSLAPSGIHGRADNCPGHIPRSKTNSSGTTIKYWYTSPPPEYCLGLVEGFYRGIFGSLLYSATERVYSLPGHTSLSHNRSTADPRSPRWHINSYEDPSGGFQVCIDWFYIGGSQAAGICRNT